eukprot:UN26519
MNRLLQRRVQPHRKFGRVLTRLNRRNLCCPRPPNFKQGTLYKKWPSTTKWPSTSGHQQQCPFKTKNLFNKNAHTSRCQYNIKNKSQWNKNNTKCDQKRTYHRTRHSHDSQHRQHSSHSHTNTHSHTSASHSTRCEHNYDDHGNKNNEYPPVNKPSNHSSDKKHSHSHNHNPSHGHSHSHGCCPNSNEKLYPEPIEKLLTYFHGNRLVTFLGCTVFSVASFSQFLSC